jgi:hypothetical protein
VGPFPIIEAEAWLAVRAVERDVHRDCAGTLVELHHEQAVIVAVSGHDGVDTFGCKGLSAPMIANGGDDAAPALRMP